MESSATTLVRTRCSSNILGCDLWYFIKHDELTENREMNKGKFICDYCSEVQMKKDITNILSSRPELRYYSMGVAYSDLLERRSLFRIDIFGNIKPKFSHKLASEFSSLVTKCYDEILLYNKFVEFLILLLDENPADIPSMYLPNFIAGFIHYSTSEETEKHISISHKDSKKCLEIAKLVNIPFFTSIDNNVCTLSFYNTNYVDLIRFIADTDMKYIDEYCRMWNTTSFPPGFTFKKTLEQGIPPFQKHISDAGFDLHLVKVVKTVHHGNGIKTVWYDTGISIRPNFGYYFKLYARSSLTSTNWYLSNGVGVIDSAYCGSIIVALTSKTANDEELSLPFRGVQLVPEKVSWMICKEGVVDTNTLRGTGGFGSTN